MDDGLSGENFDFSVNEDEDVEVRYFGLFSVPLVINFSRATNGDSNTTDNIKDIEYVTTKFPRDKYN